MRKLPWWKQALSQLALFLVAIYVILPVWGILRLAFDGVLQGRPTEFRLFPKEFTIEPLIQIWNKAYQNQSFLGLFQNTLTVSLGSALLAIVFGISLAYAFARFRFPGRQVGLFVLLLSALLPPIAFTTPLYIVLSMMKLRATLLGLVLVYAAFSMPFCIWSMRAAFQAIPKEIEEAAFLDGAGNFTTFLRVSLPLSLPSIGVAGLIAFLMGYSEFVIGWLFLEKPNTVTLAMAVYAMMSSGFLQPWSQIGSMILLIALPVMVIFFLLQRTLLNRMLYGGLDE